MWLSTVCKEHNRSAGRTTLQVAFQPLQLFVTERPHASGFQIGDIYEGNKMDALVIEAVPPVPFRALSIAVEIFLAVVAEHVVLTRLCRMDSS
jgi:hypothetical protein